MERRQIEYFLGVVDEGGFTAAATSLHVAQPSLSHAIKLLERELGAELFYRLPRGVRLTPAGDAFVDSARRVVRDLETARAQVREVVGLESGRLDLVSLPTLTLEPLAEVIGRFHSAHPQVNLRIKQPEHRREVRDAVRSGSAELGLADTDPAQDDELETVPIGKQELLATLPPGTPYPTGGRISLAQLLSMPLISGGPGTITYDRLTREAARLGKRFAPIVEVEHRESAFHLVSAGAGAALLPAPLARIAALQGAVLASVSPPVVRDIELIRRPGPLSPAARAFLALLMPNPTPSTDGHSASPAAP